jgi:hypothetical protein
LQVVQYFLLTQSIDAAYQLRLNPELKSLADVRR